MEKLQVSSLGTRRVVISNFSSFCSSIESDPQHVAKAISNNLGTVTSIDKDLLVIKGRFGPAQILRALGLNPRDSLDGWKFSPGEEAYDEDLPCDEEEEISRLKISLDHMTEERDQALLRIKDLESRMVTDRESLIEILSDIQKLRRDILEKEKSK